MSPEQPGRQLRGSVEKLVTMLSGHLHDPQAVTYPGFDRSAYPGDAMMQRLFESGAFTWAGYYLAPVPGHCDRAWVGKRSLLVQQGWGLAPIYLGYEWNHYPGMAPRPPCAGAAVVPAWVWPQDGADGGQAASLQAATVAQRDGFPDGTVIYLDVEGPNGSGTPKDARFLAYVHRWIETLPDALAAANGPRYVPGVYLHRSDYRDVVYTLPWDIPVWCTGGNQKLWFVSKSEVLDGHGMPRQRRPSESEVSIQMWQWAYDVVFKVEQCGFELVDPEGVTHRIGSGRVNAQGNPNDGLDYDTSWVADPSRTSGSGEVNQVVSVGLENPTARVVGGNDVSMTVRMARPAAGPADTRVIVTGGGHTGVGDVSVGQTEVTFPVPTDPVSASTVVQFTASTKWWPLSRAATEGPFRPTVDVTVASN